MAKSGRGASAIRTPAIDILAMQATAGNRTVSRMLGNPTVPIRRKSLVNAGHLDQMAGDWDSTTDSKGRVTRVEATNLRLIGGAGAVPTGLNEPSGSDPRSWAHLKNAGVTQGPPYYKRMHLLNGNLGGPGTKANLAPGTSSLNTHHFVGLEDPAMQELAKGATIDEYYTEVTYSQPSKHLKGTLAKASWMDTIEDIEGEFEYTDLTGTHQSPHFSASEDAGLDKKPKWKGK